ncbi:peptide MFS transporter [Nonomuraea wenchangensis]|uniref:peptide MFS transporter n=1 Tax=Nonomuraea wenchangensis TaxID=568860 RepID=UPI00332DCC30
MTSNTTRPVTRAGTGTPTGHPKALWFLAFTEFWERFSFYGLQGVLTFYLLWSLADGGLALGATDAVSIVGAYGGAVYLAQVLGAWAADRIASPRHMVLVGGIVITLGHVALAVVPEVAGVAIGLILIALGTGALKSNISSIVGMLYDEDRSKRDAGFSYFYMAINGGAALGPLLAGWTRSLGGFHAAFALAAVGMVAGLIQYSLKMRSLPARASVVQKPIDTPGLLRAVALAAGFVVVAAVAWQSGVVDSGNLTHVVALVSLAAAAAYFVTMFRSPEVTAQERRRLTGFLPLWVGCALYYGFLLQKFTAVSVFITDRVDIVVGGWEMPAEWLSTSSPLAVILLTPVVASLWTRMGDRQPPAALKYAIGFTIIGCAYLLMTALEMSNPGHTVPAFGVLAVLAIAGSSETFIGPTGLSLATRVAPERFKNQTVGVWLLALACGSSISGLFGTLFAEISNGAYFAVLGGAPLVVALMLALSAKRIDTLTR